MAETNWDELRFGMPLNVWLMIDGRAQKHIRDLYERVDVGHAIIAQQEVELARLRGALEPFARAAEDCGVIRDIEAGAVKPEQNIWESATSLSLNYEHVANAYSVLDSRKAERADAPSKSPAPSLSSLRKGAEVAVKQIDWRDMTYKGVEEWIGHCALSQSFTIKDEGEDRMPYRFTVRPFLSGVTSFPTADEAKSAAQSDFETRIRSALVSGSREDGE